MAQWPKNDDLLHKTCLGQNHRQSCIVSLTVQTSVDAAAATTDILSMAQGSHFQPLLLAQLLFQCLGARTASLFLNFCAVCLPQRVTLAVTSSAGWNPALCAELEGLDVVKAHGRSLAAGENSQISAKKRLSPAKSPLRHRS